MTPAGDLPANGTRVSIRYLRPPGSQPPMGDVVGQLIEGGQRVRVRAGDGAIHEFRAAEVLYVRRLTDRPVKNSQIRAVEHAAAMAWPGVEQQWLDGWLLRAGRGRTLRANSAIPLDRFARADTIPAIIDWYTRRDLPPLLSVPERLSPAGGWYPQPLPENATVLCETRTLVGEPAAAQDAQDTEAPADVVLLPAPDAGWLSRCGRDVPVDILTAVLDGQVVFASGAAVGRGALTESPDGTRWVGLSELAADRPGDARAVCAALLSWGRGHGATRAYTQIRDTEDTAAAASFFFSIGFTGQHRGRYLDARALVR